MSYVVQGIFDRDVIGERVIDILLSVTNLARIQEHGIGHGSSTGLGLGRTIQKYGREPLVAETACQTTANHFGVNAKFVDWCEWDTREFLVNYSYQKAYFYPLGTHFTHDKITIK